MANPGANEYSTQDHVFTHHVEAIAAGAPPTDAALRSLRRTLRRQIGQRLPVHLGYGYSASWTEVWEDVVHDCYLYAITIPCERYQTLLKDHDSIDALVHKRIRQFVVDRHRQADPAGRRLHENILCAARILLDCRQLANSRPERLGFHSVLRVPGKSARRIATKAELREQIQNLPIWENTIRTLHHRGHGAVESVAEGVRQLVAAGLQAFRIGDLIQCLSNDVHRAYLRDVPVKSRQAAHDREVRLSSTSWCEDNLHEARPVRIDYSQDPRDEPSQLRSRIRHLKERIEATRWRVERKEVVRLLLAFYVYRIRNDKAVSLAQLGRALHIPKATLHARSEDLRTLSK